MFVIVGVYRGKREEIDQTETEKDADYLVKEYAMAFGKDWTLFKEKK